jgi:hypothetical protein
VPWADPPLRVHVTVALAVPGFVVEATFQSQDTSPSAPAVGLVWRPPAPDLFPEGQITAITQLAPGEVCAVRCATPPRGAGLGKETNVTLSAVGGEVTPGVEGAAVVADVEAAVVAGFVDEATSAMP